MSARDMWRWLVFSVTGRVPVRAQGGEVTERHDTPPTVMAPGKEITDPDEAEALGLTASARRMRERRVVTAEEAAGLGLTAAPCAHPHADDSGVRGLLEHIGIDTSGGITVDGREVAAPYPANWHREERRLIAECGDTDDCCTVDTCRLDAHRLLPHSDTVKVPEDTLRGLVEVAQWVADSEPYPDPVAARRALAALDDAGLLDQLKEED